MRIILWAILILSSFQLHSQQPLPLWMLERPDSLGYVIGVDTINNDSTYIASWILLDSISTDLAFNGNRNILRVPTAGQNLGTSTVTDWLEWWYFTAPTMSITSNTAVFEIGTSNNLSWTINTTNSGGAILSGGEFRLKTPVDSLLSSFGASTSHGTPTISFTPLQNPAGRYTDWSYTVRGEQDWLFGSDSGTAVTSTKSFQAVYPVLYGTATIGLDTASAIMVYDSLNHLVQTEGDKTVIFNTPINEFFYYAVPTTWGDVDMSLIRDQNDFTVTPSFQKFDITVSSSGLTNDYINVPYKLYKLTPESTTGGVDFDYDFIR